MAQQGERVTVADDCLLDGHVEVQVTTTARIAIGEAYAYLRSRRMTAAFTLDSAIQERIEEIEGVDGAPGQMAELDEVTSKLSQAIEELKNAK